MIEKSYNKLFIGKYIALSSLLYGTNIIITLRIVYIYIYIYICIIGATHNNPNVAVRGGIGASLMRKIVINGRINYIKGIKRKINNLLVWTIQTTNKSNGLKQQENI